MLYASCNPFIAYLLCVSNHVKIVDPSILFTELKGFVCLHASKSNKLLTGVFVCLFAELLHFFHPGPQFPPFWQPAVSSFYLWVCFLCWLILFIRLSKKTKKIKTNNNDIKTLIGTDNSMDWLPEGNGGGRRLDLGCWTHNTTCRCS